MNLKDCRTRRAFAAKDRRSVEPRPIQTWKKRSRFRQSNPNSVAALDRIAPTEPKSGPTSLSFVFVFLRSAVYTVG